MLKRTPFFDIHKNLDAKLTDFGGWQMPVRYDGIKKEHTSVRNSVGMFDVSHMGELFITGPEAEDLLQYVTVNDASKLEPGKAQYSAMCYEDGGLIDDLLIYMLDDSTYMAVVNASNIEKDFEWVAEHNRFEAEVENRSADMCLLAVQGPDAAKTLQKLTDVDLSAIKFYRFEKGPFAGFDNVIISATGYTGEKGFELYFDKNDVDPAEMWEAIMEAGDELDVQPCGLGARDTLRLEMGFALYGNDITKDTNPLEARMGWLAKLDKENFIGREALRKIKEEGLTRKLAGFVLDDPRAIPRKGYDITDENGNKIGFVTSGTRSVTLNENIGMGYVPVKKAEEGKEIFVRVRGDQAKAVVTFPPFVEKD